jgi:membrane protease YdiL (CAAX protease family)
VLPDSPPPAPKRTEWSAADFALVILGGIAGALVTGLAFLSADPGTALIAGLVGQYGGHLVALRLVLRRRRAAFADLGLVVEPADGVSIFFGIALQVIIAVLFFPLAVLLEPEGTNQAISELIPNVSGTGERAVLVVSIAFLAPIVEEIMFRGLLWRVLEQRRGPRAALFGTALVFALFHLLGIGTEDPLRSAALLVPQLFVVGLVLGRQVQRRGRLGVAIFTHAGFNLVAVLALLAAPDLVS